MNSLTFCFLKIMSVLIVNDSNLIAQKVREKQTSAPLFKPLFRNQIVFAARLIDSFISMNINKSIRFSG